MDLTELAHAIRRRIGSQPEPAESPVVSLIVPSRDGEEHLGLLLGGLIERTDYPTLELIVVDNGSSDGSIELLRAAEAPFSISVLANPTNESFSGACNQGAVAAVGELLLFLNNDVEPFEPGWLRELVACLQRSGAGAVAATLLCPDSEHAKEFRYGCGVQHRGLSFVSGEDGRLVPVLRGWEEDPFDEKLGIDLECDAVAAACLLIKKSTFTEVGGFSPGYFYGCEDVDLCLKLRATGRRAVCSGRSVALHRPVSTRRQLPSKLARSIKRANLDLLWRTWGPRLDPNGAGQPRVEHAETVD